MSKKKEHLYKFMSMDDIQLAKEMVALHDNEQALIRELKASLEL